MTRIDPRKSQTVTGLDGPIRWTGDGGQVIDALGCRKPDSRRERSRRSPRDSWAEIEFLDGTKVAASGRSAITLSDHDGRKTLHLREGNLSIDAVPQPASSPLRLITPSAEAEVLGTQFNVIADSFSTRLTVNEGLVRVKRLADGRVQEVPANHVVVAALEQRTDFLAVPRRNYAGNMEEQVPSRCPPG